MNRNAAQHGAALVFASFAAAMLFGSCQGKQPDVAISGQMFIVTNSQNVIRLALVEVSAIPEPEGARYVDSLQLLRRSRVAHWQAKLDSASRQLASATAAFEEASRHRPDWTVRYIKNEISTDEWNSGDPVLNRLKAPVAQATRDVINARTMLANCNLLEIFFTSPPAPIATAQTDADGRFRIVVPDTKPLFLMAQSSRATLGNTETYFWITRVDPKAADQRSLTLTNANLLDESGIGALAARISQ